MVKSPQIFKSNIATKSLTIILLFSIFSNLLQSCSKDDDELLPQQNITEIYQEGLEAEVVSSVNKHRASLGLKNLYPIAPAYMEAINHTNYMILQGKISHDNFDQRKANLMATTSAKIVAENVAAGFNNADSVLSAWLSNPSHRKNIENPDVQFIGVSVQKDGFNRNYFTQIFTGK